MFIQYTITYMLQNFKNIYKFAKIFGQNLVNLTKKKFKACPFLGRMECLIAKTMFLNPSRIKRYIKL